MENKRDLLSFDSGNFSIVKSIFCERNIKEL
jgi:hypothetical protein